MHQYDIRDLRIHFPTRRGVVEAVRGVSFYMDQGECVALVGESGCGKSVTARSLMGLTEVTGGRCQPGSQILCHGENILDYGKKQWQSYRGREAAMIFQDAMTSLNPTMQIGRFLLHHGVRETSEHLARKIPRGFSRISVRYIVTAAPPQRRPPMSPVLNAPRWSARLHSPETP